jgi:hypothetical protein
MRVPKTRACCLLVLLVLPCSLVGQAKSDQESFKDPREFVQAFYDWYAPLALKEDSTTASDIALKQKRSSFSPQLALLLKEDSDAQAKCGELIGLDFDPFLFSQDPAEKYIVGRISRKGQNYIADVYGIDHGFRSKVADVSAEFSEKSGQWFFVNFYYPKSVDLLTMLKSPRSTCTVPRSAVMKPNVPGGFA